MFGRVRVRGGGGAIADLIRDLDGGLISETERFLGEGFTTCLPEAIVAGLLRCLKGGSIAGPPSFFIPVRALETAKARAKLILYLVRRILKVPGRKPTRSAHSAIVSVSPL